MFSIPSLISYAIAALVIREILIFAGAYEISSAIQKIKSISWMLTLTVSIALINTLTAPVNAIWVNQVSHVSTAADARDLGARWF